ncbi:MAG: hypothetical protein ACTSQ8_27075 [Candidatus Helarchaeota archaeon]
MKTSERENKEFIRYRIAQERYYVFPEDEKRKNSSGTGLVVQKKPLLMQSF